MTKTKNVVLIKIWDLKDGGIREKIVYTGTMRGAQKRIPASKKKQFRIEETG